MANAKQSGKGKKDNTKPAVPNHLLHQLQEFSPAGFVVIAVKEDGMFEMTRWAPTDLSKLGFMQFLKQMTRDIP